MKKSIKICAIFILVATLVCSFCGCSKKDVTVPDGMKKASSDDADYIMYVPKDWRVDKSSLYTSAYYSSDDATSISATAYGMNYDDSTVDDWFKGFMKDFKGLYKDVSEPKTEKATLGGVNGAKYTFSGKLNGNTYDYIIVAALRKNYIYYVTYTSTPDYYEKHLDSLNEVISNFRYK